MLRCSKSSFLFYVSFFSSFYPFSDEAIHSAASPPAPPLPAPSVLFGQPTVPEFAVGMSNAMVYGGTTGVLQKAAEHEQSSGFSVFSFGASQQQQKHPVFSAPGNLTRIDEFLYLINVQMV